MDILMKLDGDILIWIQDNIRSDFLTPIVKFITSLGNAGIIWILIAVGLLIYKKTRFVGFISLESLLLSLIVNNTIIKNIVGRTRPYEVVENLTSLIGVKTDYSFPSGHTSAAFAMAIILYVKLPKKFGISAIVLAVLIGLSRLYVGVHYPTDVIGGAIMGSIIAIVTMKIMDLNVFSKIKKALK